jgi:hypothetical protein
MLSKLSFGEEKDDLLQDLHTECKEILKEITAFLENKGIKCPENVLQQVLNHYDIL